MDLVNVLDGLWVGQFLSLLIKVTVELPPATIPPMSLRCLFLITLTSATILHTLEHLKRSRCNLYNMVYGDVTFLLRVIVVASFLIYACQLDVKTRRVPNRVWLIMIGAGTPFVLYDLAIEGMAHLIQLTISVVLIYSVMTFIFYMGQYTGGTFGGADAKAIIVLSYIMPVYPQTDLMGLSFPLFGTPLGIDSFDIIIYQGFSASTAIMFLLLSLFSSLAFTSFFNGLLIFMIIPLLIFIYNLRNFNLGEVRENPILIFFSYRSKISDLKGKHVRLIHDFHEDKGKVVRKFKFSGVKIDDEMIGKLEKWRKKGKIGEEVWVQALLPFMIAITLGFFTAVAFGNLMFAFM